MKYIEKNILKVRNEYHEEIPFYIVYEMNQYGEAIIWKKGTLQSHEEVQVLFVEREDLLSSMTEFKFALVEAGLFLDEAEAMLETWKHSYFESEGMKVFWVLPRSYTDEILPIKFNPEPFKLERVMIGRSEILTPDFEEFLYNHWYKHNLEGYYSEDRYFYAYEERVGQLKQSGLSFIEKDDFNFSKEIMIYPNPVSNLLNYSISRKNHESIEINVFNLDGVLILRSFIEKGSMSGQLDLSAFKGGVYIISCSHNEMNHNLRFVKL